ncbi:MAG TPA: hypothetical protein VJ692_15090 [Nitrospiraceae bacterium]|nr:hypothetical protein [Nitrospiraceae bacterium]
MERPTVTLVVPDGYKDADEFLKDCQFERAQIATGDLFNQLVGRINFDGMDPRTFTLSEIERAVPGAKLP